VSYGFRASFDFFLQDASAYVQTIRTNRHSQGLGTGDLVADYALRFLAERTLDDVLHAENSAPGPGGLSFDFLELSV
jgi:hypothetical protein